MSSLCRTNQVVCSSLELAQAQFLNMLPALVLSNYGISEMKNSSLSELEICKKTSVICMFPLVATALACVEAIHGCPWFYSSQGSVDVGDPCFYQRLCSCSWFMLSPEAMLISVGCDDARGHVDVSGLCNQPTTEGYGGVCGMCFNRGHFGVCRLCCHWRPC